LSSFLYSKINDKVKTIIRIGQLANIVDVTTATIRFYEQKGFMTSTKRSSNSYRHDDNDIQCLQLIKFSQGFSLDELPKIFQQRHSFNLLFIKAKRKAGRISDDARGC